MNNLLLQLKGYKLPHWFLASWQSSAIAYSKDRNNSVAFVDQLQIVRKKFNRLQILNTLLFLCRFLHHTVDLNTHLGHLKIHQIASGLEHLLVKHLMYFQTVVYFFYSTQFSFLISSTYFLLYLKTFQ